jgi:cholesterol transport system auxiliary component
MSMTVSPLSRRQILVTGLALLALGGCGGNLLGPSNPPLQLYRLRPRFTAPPDLPHVAWQLAVARPETARSLDTVRIALVRGEMMDYYADAQWTDSVPRLVQGLLVEAFEQSGRIAGVARESDNIHADYVLATEIRAFEAQYDTPDGAPGVTVEIEARLLGRGGDVAATLNATAASRAQQNSVASVVAAFDAASAEALQKIVAWVLSAPPPPGARRG